MAHLVLTNCKLYVAQYDMSGHSNALALDYSSELQDDTCWGDTTRVRLGGFKVCTLQHEGNWDNTASGLDAIYYTDIGVADKVITVCPTTGADGERAFSFRGVQASYQTGGTVGNLLPYSVSVEPSSGPLVRGTVMVTGSKTSTAAGTARQLGAVAAGSRMYAALHVFSVSGTDPTLDVVVQSDDGVGMASATDQITFTQATAATSQWLSTDGSAITDDYWRISYTIGGTDTPTFNFAVVLGII